MGLKKHLSTFVSNWLGVIIAAIIVLVSGSFGGMYLYARSRIDNTINFATQAITYYGLTKIGTIDDPAGYIYRLSLLAYNPYADTIDVSISDVSITLDTYTLPVIKDGSWDKNAPTGNTFFDGDIIIDVQTFAALADKGTVDVEIKGTISGSGQYQWVKRQIQRPINIRIIGVLFRLDPVSGSNATT